MPLYEYTCKSCGHFFELLVRHDTVLACPACGTAYAPTERFCADCGLPLVKTEGGERVSEARERARKVLPQYSEGPLTRVATARHQAEAEMIEGMLLEHGVPSLVRRSGGFDVPDFLAAGPRDILVPASGATLARELLGKPPVPDAEPPGTGTPAWVKAILPPMAPPPASPREPNPRGAPRPASSGTRRHSTVPALR